jgi:glutathione synthase/RimK-type ligase-like ATP-grasp enzyme
MPRVCFVTCTTWPEISASDRLVADALESRGVPVEGRAWNDRAADFTGFDAVVLRSNWDYHFEPEAFLAWLDRTERAGVRLFNPPALVRWNVSKRYLLALAAAGVPTVATTVLDEPTRDAIEAGLRRHGPTVVLKPAIAASAHGTRLVSAATVDETLRVLEAGVLRPPLLVQPFVEEVQTRGEWALIFIEDELAHAVLKRPGPGEFRVQGAYGGSAEAATAPPGVVAVGRRALAALPAPPLYARIDAVDAAAGPLVMEAEVNEPGLFFTHAPAAAARFAEALLRRLGASA